MGSYMFNNYLFGIEYKKIKERKKGTNTVLRESALYRESVALSSLGITIINQEGPRTHNPIHNNKIISSQMTNR